MAGRPTIQIDCTSLGCPNYQMLRADDDLPTRWQCSSCVDRATEQMINELHRAELNRLATEPTKENRT